jgi:hypothetical protein
MTIYTDIYKDLTINKSNNAFILQATIKKIETNNLSLFNLYQIEHDFNDGDGSGRHKTIQSYESTNTVGTISHSFLKSYIGSNQFVAKSSTGISNLEIFVDNSDNILKYKDNSGTFHSLIASTSGYVPDSRQVIAGTGLTDGGA